MQRQPSPLGFAVKLGRIFFSSWVGFFFRHCSGIVYKLNCEQSWVLQSQGACGSVLIAGCVVLSLAGLGSAHPPSAGFSAFTSNQPKRPGQDPTVAPQHGLGGKKPFRALHNTLPALSRDITQIRLLRADRDETSTSSLGNLCRCLTTLNANSFPWPWFLRALLARAVPHPPSHRPWGRSCLSHGLEL